MNINKEFYKFNKYGFLDKPNLVKINFELLQKKILDYSEKIEEINWGEIRFDSNAKLGKITTKGGLSIVNTIGWIEEIDEMVNSVIGEFKDLIDFTLPNGWIITQVAIRISSPGDNELGLHTDTAGEYGIGILLNNWFSDSATTCFLPGTHKWPFTLREITGIPRIPTYFMNKLGLLKSAKGEAGTSYFFCNNTLHGRMANNTNKQNFTILISIFDLKKAPRNFDDSVLKKIKSSHDAFLKGLTGINLKSSKLSKDNNLINLKRKNKFFLIFIIIKLIFLPLSFLINTLYYQFILQIKKIFK